MKTNGTQIILKRFILFILLLLYFLIIFSQPKYDFRNKTLVSGTNNQVGAVYRFNNVASGVDAFVTILNMTGGLTLNDVDGGGGFVEALQPVIVIPAKSSGYAEFQIDFLTAGTSNPMVQTEVPMTAIDVDGQVHSPDTIFEFDMIQYNPPAAYFDYNFSGLELDITFPSGWVQGNNIAAIDYAGIDTSAKQVMFTVVNGNISSVIFRVGAKNNTNSSRQRLRSVYFQTFYYPNSILLKAPALTSFDGMRNKNAIELGWTLSRGNTVNSLTLERSFSGRSFAPVAEFWPNLDGISKTQFTYSDKGDNLDFVCYRLKLTSSEGKTEYSNILTFVNNSEMKDGIKVYPTIVNDKAFTMIIPADNRQQALVEIMDYSGNIVYKKQITLENGMNKTLINDLGSLVKGSFIVVTRANNKVYTGKLIIK